jgi:hypothetical protein
MTYGFLSRVREDIWVSVYHRAFNLICPATIVSEACSHGCNVIFGYFKCLSIVKRFNGTQEIKVLFNQGGERDHQLSSLLGSHPFPGPFECLARCRYGDIDVLLCSLMNRCNYLFGRRIDDLDGLAINASDELIVDEPKPVRASVTAFCYVIQDHLQTGRLSVLATSWRGEFN